MLVSVKLYITFNFAQNPSYEKIVKPIFRSRAAHFV